MSFSIQIDTKSKTLICGTCHESTAEADNETTIFSQFLFVFRFIKLLSAHCVLSILQLYAGGFLNLARL